MKLKSKKTGKVLELVRKPKHHIPAGRLRRVASSGTKKSRKS